MKLTPLTKLVPGVEEMADRLVFQVNSRSRPRKHVVDLERRHGLGQCTCEQYAFAGHECFHLNLVRKYVAAKVAQVVIQKYAKK